MFGFVARAKYEADLKEAQEDAAFARQGEILANERCRLLCSDKDARIYELQENCFELTVERNALLRSRQKSNANLIPGGPKALEKRRAQAVEGAAKAVRASMEVEA